MLTGGGGRTELAAIPEAGYGDRCPEAMRQRRG